MAQGVLQKISQPDYKNPEEVLQFPAGIIIRKREVNHLQSGLHVLLLSLCRGVFGPGNRDC